MGANNSKDVNLNDVTKSKIPTKPPTKYKLESKKKPFVNSIIKRSCTTVEKNKNLKRAVQNLPTSAIFLKSSIWGPGSSGTISVSFSGGSAQSSVGNVSNNSRPSMYLGWVDPPFSDSFDYFGSEIPIENTNNEHRNYGFLDEYVAGATVIHEFGHALGLYHEHQSDLFGSNPIVFKRPTCY